MLKLKKLSKLNKNPVERMTSRLHQVEENQELKTRSKAHYIHEAIKERQTDMTTTLKNSGP